MPPQRHVVNRLSIETKTGSETRTRLEDKGISGASFGHALDVKIGGGVRNEHEAEDGAYNAHGVEGRRIQHARSRDGV